MNKPCAVIPGCLALGLLLPRFAFAADDTFEIIQATERPIPISLSLNTERQVLFPDLIWSDVPKSLDAVLEIEVVGKSVFIKPRADFPDARILIGNVNEDDVQYILLLEVDSHNQVLPPVRIRPAVRIKAQNVQSPDTEQSDAPGPVVLSRWLSQQFYAPMRLHHTLSGLLPIDVEDRPTRRLILGDRVDATPIGAWQSGDWYLTAVVIRNITAGIWEWDPRQLRGTWLYATPQHSWLGPRGDDTDTSTVYLISAVPWGAALPALDP